MKTTKQKFTTREKAKLALVFEAYRVHVSKVVKDGGQPYSSSVGCGNCGDLSATFITMYNLEVAVGLREPKD